MNRKFIYWLSPEAEQARLSRAINSPKEHYLELNGHLRTAGLSNGIIGIKRADRDALVSMFCQIPSHLLEDDDTLWKHLVTALAVVRAMLCAHSVESICANEELLDLARELQATVDHLLNHRQGETNEHE